MAHATPPGIRLLVYIAAVAVVLLAPSPSPQAAAASAEALRIAADAASPDPWLPTATLLRIILALFLCSGLLAELLTRRPGWR